MTSAGAGIRMRRSVLVVAQQIEQRARIARMLQSVGYAVELAGSQKRALELVSTGKIEAAIVVDLPDLAQEVLDKLPKATVLACRTDQIIRQTHSVQAPHAFPVQGLDEQKLLEQLGRPTASRWIVGNESASAPRVFSIGNCKLDLASRTFVDGNGGAVQLTRCESALLSAFVSSPCHVLSRNELRHAVVGRGAEPFDRNIDMLVARLRRKIEPDAKRPTFVLTVPGLGYKFAARPQSVDNVTWPARIDLEFPTKAYVSAVNTAPEKVIPPGAPDQLGSRLRAARRQVTVVSCRLVDSMPLAASLDPEDFASTIDHFQGICISVISKWGGVVANFVADETLALFGYPESHENNAERAVDAGLDLLSKIGEFLPGSGKPLRARIAIATSLVLVGDNQTPAGEAIITASRLLNATGANSVTVCESTRRLLGNAFICHDAQLCKLQGSSKAVPIYRVTDKSGSRYNYNGVGSRHVFVGGQ
jgi:class 3 adenylate cyclase/DNA-binding response OmpR family regulator